MNQSPTYQANHQKLFQLMQQARITSLSQLSQVSGVSQWQLNRLLVGLMPKMALEDLLKLAKVLQVPLTQFLTQFSPHESLEETPTTGPVAETLNREYQHLQQQLTQQKATLEQEFQRSSLEVLESWLLQWPTAAIIAQKNPQLSATKLLPLTKPIFDLLKQWGLEMNASVGEKVSYDPQSHQLLEGGGAVKPGDTVIVRYVGYSQREKLLYRAKVSAVIAHEQ